MPSSLVQNPVQVALPRLSGNQRALFFIILFAGAFLRFYQISKPNMWLDEIWKIEMSMGNDSVHDHLPLGVIQDQNIDITNLAAAPPWWHVWSNLTGCFHPPVYHVLLRLWMNLLGDSTSTARSFSALFSFLGLIVFFDTCRRTLRLDSAFLAAAMMALSVCQIDFAQQTCEYTLLVFLALCCGNLILRIQTRGANLSRLAALSLAIFITSLTHYFAAAALLALAVCVTIQFRGKDRWKTLGAFAAAGILATLVWFPWFLKQQQYLATLGNTLFPDPDNNLLLTLLRVSLQPFVFTFGDIDFSNFDLAALCVTGLAGLAILVLPILLALRNPVRFPGILFWSLWIFTTFGWLAALDLSHHTHILTISRYTLLASPGVYALIANLSWTRLRLLRFSVVSTIIASMCVFTLPRARQGFSDNVGNMHAMAGLIDTNVPPDGIVIFYSPSPWDTPGIWYMGWQYYSPGAKRKWMALKQPADAAVEKQLASFDAIWCVGVNPSPDWQTIFSGWQTTGKSLSCSAGTITQLRPNTPKTPATSR